MVRLLVEVVTFLVSSISLLLFSFGISSMSISITSISFSKGESSSVINLGLVCLGELLTVVYSVVLFLSFSCRILSGSLGSKFKLKL